MPFWRYSQPYCTEQSKEQRCAAAMDRIMRAKGAHQILDLPEGAVDAEAEVGRRLVAGIARWRNELYASLRCKDVAPRLMIVLTVPSAAVEATLRSFSLTSIAL